MHAVLWLLGGGTCQHLVALKTALPDLAGCPQHGREYVPAFLSCLPSLLFTRGVMLWRWDLAGPAATAPGVSGGTGSWGCACRTSPCRVAAPAPTGLPCLCLPETQNSRKHLWDHVCDCPYQLPLSIKTWRLKGCSWGSAEARETSAAVWWQTLTCLLLLSVRALNHFVLFHPITWIHFKLWNSPFLPWLIYEICHLSLWFTLCPS